MASPETPLIGSQVPGYTVEDFPTACVNDPERECPFRLELVLQYVGEVHYESDGSVPARAFEDSKVLKFKLNEHDINATFIGCANSTDKECAPQQAMNNNPVRKTGVKGARAIMKLFGIRGH